MMTAAVLALAGCNRGATSANTANSTITNASAATPAATSAPTASADAANGLPAGFLDPDPGAQAANCYGFLTVAQRAGAQPAGRDGPIMEQAANQWLAATPRHETRSPEEVKEALEPMIAAMGSVPPAQRDAAAAWCVERAPETDPEG